jgi:hypothetical protein
MVVMVVTPDPLQRIQHLYHFTDVSNLPKIAARKGLLATARLREAAEVFCSGGDEDSLRLDTRCGMDQYVHLCFPFSRLPWPKLGQGIFIGFR